MSVLGSDSGPLLSSLFRSINASVHVNSSLGSLGSCRGVREDSIRIGLGIIALVAALDLLPDVLLGEVGGIVPSVVISRAVDLCQLVLARAHFASSIRSGIACNVSEKNGGITHCDWCKWERESQQVRSKLTELAELAIGDDQGSKSPHPLESLVSVLLGALLVDRGIRNIDSLRVE